MLGQSTKKLVAVFVAGVALVHVATGFVGASTTSMSRVPFAPALRATSPRTPGANDAQAPARNEPLRVASAVVSLFAALLVALAPVTEAQAAKSGGRIGSSAPSRREQRAPPTTRRAAEPPSVVNKTTVINKTVVVAPPPPPPVVVAPPPVIGITSAPVLMVPPPPTLGDVIVGAAVSSAISSAVAPPRGPSVSDRIMENQIRQDERQLDKQATQIEDLQRELRDLKK